MADPIFLLDFRRGTVEAIDESLPPKGARAPLSAEPEQLPTTPGYEFATLGTPPRPDDQ